jgi:hypothetical protein
MTILRSWNGSMSRLELLPSDLGGPVAAGEASIKEARECYRPAAPSLRLRMYAIRFSRSSIGTTTSGIE